MEIPDSDKRAEKQKSKISFVLSFLSTDTSRQAPENVREFHPGM